VTKAADIRHARLDDEVISSTTHHDQTGSGFITAWAEMGSATSRNPPGRRHLVRLSAPATP
jgi:hypothetical protein